VISQTSVANLPGAHRLVEWFEHWPSFHDAEVTCIELNRDGVSHLRIHCFRMTDRIDDRGYYISDKHAIVSLILEDIKYLELTGFNHQNVLSSLSMSAVEDGYEVVLGDCYGVSGRIVARTLSFDLQPGMPTNSTYAETI